MSALILVADADPFNLRLLQEVCEASGHRVVTSGEGGEVLDVVARERPDLVLLDQGIAGLDGLQVLRILKGEAALSRIPVLLVTASSDVESRRRAIELGADDYLTKPYLVFEVQQRIRNTLRANRGERAGATDVDPELGTKAQLAIGLEYELTRAARYRHPLAAAVLRVSNHGTLDKEAGSRWQVVLGRVLRSCLRATDQVYLSQPDEIVLVLPETDRAGGQVVLDRVRARLAEPLSDLPVAPAVRAALCAHPDDGVEDARALLATARAAVTGS